MPFKWKTDYRSFHRVSFPRNFVFQWLGIRPREHGKGGRNEEGSEAVVYDGISLAHIRAIHKEVKGAYDSPRMTADIVPDGVVSPTVGPGLIHHSDRGSQYASGAFQAQLHQYGMQCSMSRKGNCWDNACSESLFNGIPAHLA